MYTLAGNTDRQRRNQWVATPGQILAEMRTTRTAVRELATAVYGKYRRPLLDLWDRVEADFRSAHGGRAVATPDHAAGEKTLPAAQKVADWEWFTARLTELSGRQTTLRDLQAKAWRGDFVEPFQRFHDEFETWYSANSGYLSRLWGGVWEKAIEYRRQALAWRTKFEQLERGNKLASPAPTIPEDPWDFSGPGRTLRTAAWIVGGLAAVAVGAPLVRSAVGRRK